MKAISFNRFDGPDALEIIDAPNSRPHAGQVLIQIKAAGVNFFETLMLRDRYAVTPDLPMIPGVEIAGKVAAIGEGVVEPAVGARVAVPMFAVGRGTGGYAEYLTIEADSVIPIPDTLSFEIAAGLMVQGLTALHLVRQSKPEGKTVLVTAAAGGVGSLLVQLAKKAGASCVIAAASSSEKLQRARSLGADAGVDYMQPDWADRVRDVNGGRGVDILYETVGGNLTKAGLAALAPCGEIVFGALGRVKLAPADLEEMFANNQSVRGFSLLPLLTATTIKADLAQLFQQAADGDLKVLLGDHYTLEQAADAHRALESRQSMGKLVLSP